MQLTNTEGIIEYLSKEYPSRLTKRIVSNKHSAGSTIYRKVFKGITFSGNVSIEFKRCKFVKCDFRQFFGFFCIFLDCEFEHCQFINTRFSHIELEWRNLSFKNCYFKNVQLDEGDLFNIYFEDCHFEMFLMYGFTFASAVRFLQCYFQTATFQSIIYYDTEDEDNEEYPDFYFEDCLIDLTTFNNCDLRYSIFHNTALHESSFIHCKLNKETLQAPKKAKFDWQASIDFATILKSQSLPMKTLKDFFNINDPDIKNFIKKITTVMNYKKVFISYSFKDQRIAQLLHKELTNRGISCFFWEKDAPPGKPLKSIMADNIDRHDKILFIASENSIRSEACQFELSSGREKQKKTWEDILFPVHLDNYLFEVKKDQIRPLNAIEEYWGNIEELRTINSVDFKSFNKSRINRARFSEAVNRIVSELAIRSEVKKP